MVLNPRTQLGPFWPENHAENDNKEPASHKINNLGPFPETAQGRRKKHSCFLREGAGVDPLSANVRFFPDLSANLFVFIFSVLLVFYNV